MTPPPARPSTRAARTRTPTLDAQCAAAVDLARAGAEDVAGLAAVGPHQRVIAEADRVVTHVFACHLGGYRGWEWAVTVARASRSRDVTISETVLLPGEGALLAPEWLPWSERIQPGDLSVGEILPTAEDDPRLDPGYVTQARDVRFGGEIEAEPDLDLPGVLAYELGLGRVHVLSAYGRDDATTRWYEGDRGPTAPVAQAAPGQCSTCGYLVPLGGQLRSVFGVCANAWSPDDGQVVSYDHGCGAHSEATAQTIEALGETVVDTENFDLIDEAVDAPADTEGPEDAEDLARS
ncbi:MAG: DUF3027 domain-containing protein [Actinomycetota bacterium]|nr:DUF3027 domain-containing protein [Actinomycetota bacterium]